MPFNNAAKSLLRDEIHHLREQRLACVHAILRVGETQRYRVTLSPFQIVDTPESSETILNTGLLGALRQTEIQLARNQFAVQAAVVSADANANNYADADAEASKLFTSLRQYLDSARDDAAVPALTETLSVRDQMIAGLAKADPGTPPELVQIFKKLQSLSSQTAQ